MNKHEEKQKTGVVYSYETDSIPIENSQKKYMLRVKRNDVVVKRLALVVTTKAKAVTNSLYEHVINSLVKQGIRSLGNEVE